MKKTKQQQQQQQKATTTTTTTKTPGVTGASQFAKIGPTLEAEFGDNL